MLDALAPIRLVALDGAAIRRAVEARAAYGVHFYDALILATAERAGCARVWSVDLNPGQRYFGVLVENPFREPLSSSLRRNASACGIAEWPNMQDGERGVQS